VFCLTVLVFLSDNLCYFLCIKGKFIVSQSASNILFLFVSRYVLCEGLTRMICSSKGKFHC